MSGDALEARLADLRRRIVELDRSLTALAAEARLHGVAAPEPAGDEMENAAASLESASIQLASAVRHVILAKRARAAA